MQNDPNQPTDPTPEAPTTENTNPTPEPPKEEPKVEEPSKEEPKADEPKVEPLTAEAVKLPEGVEVNQEAFGSFIEIMNNAELSPQERAQQLIDLQLKYAAEASEAISTAYEKTREEWAESVRADPKIGGAALEANLGKISKMIDQHGTPELREALDLTGAGDHPEVVKFFLNLANKFTEGGPTPSAAPTTPVTEEERAARLYPSMQK